MTDEKTFIDKKQVIMIAVLMTGAALSVLNQTSVSPMLPVIMGELDITSPVAQRRIKKVPVVDDGHLIGTINRDDVVRHIMDMLAKAEA